MAKNINKRITKLIKTGEDLYRLQLINANTVDKNGQILGNTAGWDQVFKTLEAEGVALGDASYADKMGAQELPEELRIKLGAKKGTTFAQQWPGRFAALKSSIKSGHTKAVKAELDFQKAEGDKLLNLPLASGASECLNLPIRFLKGLLLCVYI